MKRKEWLVLIIFFLIFDLLNGCVKEEENISLSLIFSEFSKDYIKDIETDTIGDISYELTIDNKNRVFLYSNKETGQIDGGININDKYYRIDEVSVGNTPKDLMGITEVQVFGKKAIKFFGLQGVNYAQSFYWFFEDNTQIFYLNVEGNTVETDLNNDGSQEIISTLGTIPETSIYILKNDKIVTSNINDSIGVKAVIYKEKNIFEIWSEPNSSEQYYYYNDSLNKSSDNNTRDK